MNYPVWDVPFGLPLLIAVMANVHVFIAHFAVGGGLFLVVTESVARRKRDEALLDFAVRYSRMFILWTLVLGTITGVGIWFTIALIHPSGTSALIHLFVWFWATEWVFFIVEISSALIYFNGWKRMSARAHLTVGWIYFIGAWLSLAVINGIITFMLTPGGWTESGNIWQGFFNPTYLPSLIIRSLLALVIAALFAITAAALLSPPSLKQPVVRTAGLTGTVALVLMAPVALWYFHSLPETVITTVAGGWRGLDNAVAGFKWSLGLLLAGLIFSALLRPTGINRLEGGLLALLGLTLISSFEWSREAARKPFVIRDYMFANELLVSEEASVRNIGFEARTKWKGAVLSERGRELFQSACARCHSITGYNGLAKSVAVKGWTSEELAPLIQRIEHFRGAMPPFWGFEGEARWIADYLVEEAKKVKIKRPIISDGERVWQRNCNLCHDEGFFRERRTFDGMGADEASELIQLTGEMMDEMPPFMGSNQDARALAEYLIKRTTGEDK